MKRVWILSGLLVAVGIMALTFFLIGDQQSATGQTQVYKFCNFSLQTPPGVEAFLADDILSGQEVIVVKIGSSDETRSSAVEIDVVTGKELRRYIRAVPDQAVLNQVLASISVANPSPAWPRDNVSPALDREDLTADRSYQPPDPEAGIHTQVISTSDGIMMLVFKTCAGSRIKIDMQTGEPIGEPEIVLSETEMFERLIAEVK